MCQSCDTELPGTDSKWIAEHVEMREVFNSDAAIYGGGNVGNGGRIQAEDTGAGGVLSLTLPPLAGVILVPEF